MGKIRVRRRGYYRRGHYRRTKTGRRVWVKGAYVPPTTYERVDIGKPGKGRKVIEIREPGELRKHGYSTRKSAVARRRALAKAVREDGATTVWRRLHAQYVLRKSARTGRRAHETSAVTETG
jgi:hypothetical protein